MAEVGACPVTSWMTRCDAATCPPASSPADGGSLPASASGCPRAASWHEDLAPARHRAGFWLVRGAAWSGWSGACDGCDGSRHSPSAPGRQVRRFGGGGNPAGGTFARVSRHGRAQRGRTAGWLGRLAGNMTASNGASGLAGDCEQDMGGLAGLAGLEAAAGQLGERIAVLRAEQARRQAGVAITRPAWKNLVFTGGPGDGQVPGGQGCRPRLRRARAAVVRARGGGGRGERGWRDPPETGVLVGETVRRAAGGIVMIPDAHAWCRLPDRGQQVLRRLYQELTEWRDDLAVILAGQAGPLASTSSSHAVAGRGTSCQRVLLIRKAGRLFRATLPGHVRGGWRLLACV